VSFQFLPSIARLAIKKCCVAHAIKNLRRQANHPHTFNIARLLKRAVGRANAPNGVVYPSPRYATGLCLAAFYFSHRKRRSVLLINQRAKAFSGANL